MFENAINLVAPVLARYPAWRLENPQRVLEMPAGFSGARVWRIDTANGSYCLRRWPDEPPSCERLKWIHAVLRNTARERISFVPVPFNDDVGDSFVEFQKHFWQLENWMPGAADFHVEPRPERLRVCSNAVARLHQAMATFRIDQDSKEIPSMQPSPEVVFRHVLVRRWLRSDSLQWTQLIRREVWPAGFERITEWIDLFSQAAPRVVSELECAARLSVALQPCVRDLWHDHVLFSGDQVTGIIDFDAMRVDNVTTDLARLIGSLVGDDANGWQTALNAYQHQRPLSAAERQLLVAFDHSATLLSPASWYQWIFVERRQFPDHEKILKRLDQQLARLRHFVRTA